MNNGQWTQHSLQEDEASPRKGFTHYPIPYATPSFLFNSSQARRAAMLGSV